MALKVADRVKEVTSTTGTGTYALGGAGNAFQAFSDVGVDGDTFYYAVFDTSGWEVGIGTLGTSGTTLARTTILDSSNGGLAVNWGTGTKDIFLTYPSSKAVYQDASGNIQVPGTVDGRDVAADGTKLDGIEAGATADQTASEILTAIKTVDGSGSGLDADLLDGNHATAFATAAQGALADSALQSSDIGVSVQGYNANTVVDASYVHTDNNYTTTEKNKLAGIEAGATADQTASEILTAIKTVDGAASGLDADLLDGNHASAFATSGHTHSDATTLAAGFMSAADKTKLDGVEAGATADQTAAEILTAIKTVDGAGSGLDADLLDGQSGAYYTGYTDTAIANLVAAAPTTLDTLNELAAALGNDPNFATTVSTQIGTKLDASSYTAADVLTKIKTVDGAASGLDADLLDGNHASAFSLTSHNHTLDSLSNTTITTIASGEILKWNGTAWVNNTLAEAGIQAAGSYITTATTFGGDVSGTYNAIVVADDSHNHIIANVDGLQTALDGKSATTHNHTLDSLSNTTITSNTSGEILKWNGTAWVNNTLAEAGIQPAGSYLTTSTTFGGDVSGTYNAIVVADDSHNHIIANVDGLQTALDGKSATTHNHTLDSLSNTTITSNTAGEILKWSGTAWINNTLAEAGIQPAGSYLTGNQTITLSGDLSGSGTTSINAQLAANVVGANELNVVGNGTTAQYLRSDGDGTFTWATPPDTNTTYTAGGGLTLAGTVFSHTDTSAQASVNNSGNAVIQDVTLDTYGHVTGLVSATIIAPTTNGTSGQMLVSSGTATPTWTAAPVGATGGGSDKIFWENDQTVTTNYTITAGKNAGSFGPITIASGVTVTVGSGDTWTVV